MRDSAAEERKRKAAQRGRNVTRDSQAVGTEPPPQTLARDQYASQQPATIFDRPRSKFKFNAIIHTGCSYVFL